MYPNLRAEMARYRITNDMLAQCLGINAATMSAKLNDKDRLKFSEAKKIHDVFFKDMDILYLFEDETFVKEVS